MPYYNNWDDLSKAITADTQKKCKAVLDKYVAPVAEEIVKKHIQTDIYDAYTPKPGGWVNGTTYQRRHMLGRSVYHSFISNDEILITSRETVSKPIVKGSCFRDRHPGSFLELLESGRMGIWKNGFPRPAISNAQDEIDSGTEIESAIQSGIDTLFN